jgi:hypothetical protein
MNLTVIVFAVSIIRIKHGKQVNILKTQENKVVSGKEDFPGRLGAVLKKRYRNQDGGI